MAVFLDSTRKNQSSRSVFMQPNQPQMMPSPKMIKHHIELAQRRIKLATDVRDSYAQLAEKLGEYSVRSVPAQQDVILAAISILNALHNNVVMDLDILATELRGAEMALQQATSHIVLPTMRGN
jgi:hypothetical protein